MRPAEKVRLRGRNPQQAGNCEQRRWKVPGTLVKLPPALAGEFKGLHRTARISCGSCEQYLTSGINQHRPVAHARRRDCQNIFRLCAELGHHLMRGITEETPYFQRIEVVT